VVVAGAVVAAWPTAAAAFGPSGHRVAGHVANRYLCAETRAALEPLLAGMTLAEAGLWPDAIRRVPEWEHTRPWHYINVPDGGAVPRAAAGTTDNVLAVLARFERELGDRTLPARQRGIALRFVVHFVADIHQPLHVGREADRGGNGVPVTVDGEETNLHALWDGEPLRPAPGIAPRDWARRLPRPSAAEVARWQAAGPVAWARESLALRPRVYALRPGPGPVAPDPAYLAGARATVEQRLLMAGVRLAGRLDRVLGPGRPCGGEVARAGPNL
jgi:hypothetical protein